LAENVAVNGLMWEFLWRFFSGVEDWATAEVSGWPGDLASTAGAEARTMDRFRAALTTSRGL
jgi:hypothetical protein